MAKDTRDGATAIKKNVNSAKRRLKREKPAYSPGAGNVHGRETMLQRCPKWDTTWGKKAIA